MVEVVTGVSAGSAEGVASVPVGEGLLPGAPPPVLHATASSSNATAAIETIVLNCRSKSLLMSLMG
jgi:hypothetical protein